MGREHLTHDEVVKYQTEAAQDEGSSEEVLEREPPSPVTPAPPGRPNPPPRPMLVDGNSNFVDTAMHKQEMTRVTAMRPEEAAPAKQ